MARVTNVELAEAVGLSPSPCLVRVKRLEKAGYILGYGAQIQMQKLGDTQIVFTEVTLSDHRSADFARFEAAIRKVDEIIECHLVSGGYDYLLKFVTRNVQHYQEIIERLLELSIGIEKYFSYLVIKSIFVKQHYPLERFFGRGSDGDVWVPPRRHDGRARRNARSWRGGRIARVPRSTAALFARGAICGERLRGRDRSCWRSRIGHRGLLVQLDEDVSRGVLTAHPVVLVRAPGRRGLGRRRQSLDLAVRRGHNHPRVVEAVRAQFDRISHAAFQVRGVSALPDAGRRLNALVGDGYKSILLTTGVEAVERGEDRAGLHQPAGGGAFRGGFHGRTLLGMTLTGMSVPYRQNFGPFAPAVFHAPYPNVVPRHLGGGCAARAG